MAAVFLQYSYNNNSASNGGTGNNGDVILFQDSFLVQPNVYIGFLSNLVGPSGFLIVNEVTMQHNDTVQYFLTFDDVIDYFYFGKGLGAMNINGMVFANCYGEWTSINLLLQQLGSIRGTTQTVQFGNVSFSGVLSSFNLRASADAQSTHVAEFALHLDIISNSLPSPRFNSACNTTNYG